MIRTSFILFSLLLAGCSNYQNSVMKTESNQVICDTIKHSEQPSELKIDAQREAQYRGIICQS
ncbi:hypothetical protein MHO82_18785 [Vibrio sp. Of7-15]|uniref:hypothetical protein n=1 Tax=Vibrio sp. Of7-15 TaxID=2724879 RepID=UPI001EF36835|nr:hypothetical protein [Vibrio sp. Of7-15]MCG7498915.1 hypothetical protein [Vibrio sp. Of7-15]